MSGEHDAHVAARRDHIRVKAARGDERARRPRDDGSIASINALLARWGRWAIRCESGALGFAAACSLGASGDGDSYDSAAPRGVIDEDMEAVDGAVRRLPPILRVVVVQVYVHGADKSDRKNAEALGINNITLGKYRADAQQRILLDISRRCNQNPSQSDNGGNSLRSTQPVAA